MSAWNLIESGRFDEACKQADHEYKLSGSLLPLRNKVVALLELGRFTDAEELSKNICTLRKEETSSDSIFLGVIQWIQDRRAEAICAWQQATKAKYSDAAGGVEPWLLLLYAAKAEKLSSIGRQATKVLNDLYQKNIWPAPLAAYLLGKIDKVVVKDCISNIPALHQKQSTQAEFYFGVFSTLDERKRHFWRSAFDYVPDSYIVPERHLSLKEFNSYDTPTDFRF